MMRITARPLRSVTARAGLLLLALGIAATFATAVAPSAQASLVSCPAPTAGQLSCAVLVNGSVGTGPLASTPAGYGPGDLQVAYGVQGNYLGMRQTVAVVEAGGDPNAVPDLNTYRAQYGLPNCNVNDDCLTVINQTGGTTLPPPDTGYTQQIPTDLDMVSALCPNCHLLLIEADDNSITNLGQAVDEAVSQGARIINFSYSGPEDPSETTQWDPYFNHPGVAIIAAAGNTGYSGGPLQYPAASPYVTSVGGTVLDQTGASGCTTSQAGARGWCETAWSQTSSGCSQYEPKPSWQGTTNCTGRADNDLAAVASSTASPSAPVAVYDSYNDNGWIEAGETGVSTPIIAGIYADAGTPGTSDNPAAYPYQHPGGGYIKPGTAYPYFDGLNDLTSGSTGSCSPTDLCTAGAGWDGPTGVGTPAATLSLTATGTSTGAIYGDGFSKCLDDYHGNLADNNPVDIYTCNGSSNSQNWTLEPDGTIHINGSSYCIGVAQGNTGNNTPIILYTCNGHTSQQWRIRSNGELLNDNSGTCLEDPSSGTDLTQLVIYTCNNVSNQDWRPQYQIPTSTGDIISQADTSKCADWNNSAAPVTMYTCGQPTGESWTINANGTITGKSGECLTPGEVIVGGINLYMKSCTGIIDQVWRIKSDGEIYNPSWDECVEANGTSNNSIIVVDTCNGFASQRWTLP
jgi:subtilase family serine protease